MTKAEARVLRAAVKWYRTTDYHGFIAAEMSLERARVFTGGQWVIPAPRIEP